MSLLSQRITAMVDACTLAYEAKHIFLKTQEPDGTVLKYPVDVWHIAITYGVSRTFHNEYFTGIGNRILAPHVKKERGGYGSLTQFYTEAQAIKAGWLMLPTEIRSTMGKESTERKRKEATISLVTDFLHSSLLDASSANETFKSWASEFGYDGDSIRALKIYLVCQDTRDKLLQVFGSEMMNELSQLEH